MTPPSKDELRRRVGERRRAMSDADREAGRARIRAIVLDRAANEHWACVAAYVPLRTEPGSAELLEGLQELGVRVLVPVTLPDRDLDWARWPGSAAIGREAVAGADAVIVPALAVAVDGTRLGRGGGSYDRTLPRRAAGAPVVALLFDGETVPELAREPWDVPVSAVVTPSGWADVAAGIPPAGTGF